MRTRRRIGLRQAGGGARQIELDHLGRARADQEQQLDIGPPREQLGDDPVQLLVGVGEPGEIALFHDRGRKARFGEDHHAGGRLDQMRAGARADDEEEGVLDLAMQPDDAGQPAEHLALAALAQDGRVAAARSTAVRVRSLRQSQSANGSGWSGGSAARRAARSLSRNWVALTT